MFKGCIDLLQTNIKGFSLSYLMTLIAAVNVGVMVVLLQIKKITQFVKLWP